MFTLTPLLFAADRIALRPSMCDCGSFTAMPLLS